MARVSLGNVLLRDVSFTSAGAAMCLIFILLTSFAPPEKETDPLQAVEVVGEDKDGFPPPPPAGKRNMQVRVFLQGYYNVGTGEMRQAHEEKEGGAIAPRWDLPTSDMLTIRLHEVGNYNNVLQTVNETGNGLTTLKTNGKTTVFVVSDDINQEVWVSVRHRNHLETVYGTPIDLTQDPGKRDFEQELIVVDFTQEKDGIDPSYGENQHQFSDGKFGIYGGDINGDGFIDGLDLTPVILNGRAGAEGYLDSDVTGDGYVDGLDLTPVILNGRAGVERVIPPSR